jgi:TP901 family phage tail tape measure protein
MQDMLRYRVTAVDQTGRGLKSVRQELGGVKGALRGVGDQARATALMMRGPVVAAATLAVGSFAMLAKNALSAAEGIADTAKAANSSIEGLQKLRFAADQNGSSAAQMDDALTRLTRRLSLYAQDGSGPAAKAIEQLGLNIRTASGEVRNSDDVFRDIAQRLSTIEDEGQRAALASQFFGDRIGAQLVPLLSQGENGLRTFGAEAERLGIVLDDVGVNKAAGANAQLRALGLSLKNQLYQVVLDNADAIVALGTGLSGILSVIGTVVAGVAGLATELVSVYDAAVKVLGLASRGSTGATYGSRNDVLADLYGLTPRQASRRSGEVIPGDLLLPPQLGRIVPRAGSSRGLNAVPPSLGSGLRTSPTVLGEDITNTVEGLRILGIEPGGGGGGSNRVVAAIKPVKGALEEVEEAAFGAGAAFKDTIKSFITGSQSAGDAVRNLAARLLDTLLDRALQPLADAFDTLFDGLFAGIGGGGGGGTRASRPPRPRPFAKGGIVNGATLFGMAAGGLGVMGEAGPEAILPLTRIGGDLGVRAQISAAPAAAPMTVSIVVNGAQDPEAVVAAIEARLLPQMRAQAAQVYARNRREWI